MKCSVLVCKMAQETMWLKMQVHPRFVDFESDSSQLRLVLDSCQNELSTDALSSMKCNMACLTSKNGQNRGHDVLSVEDGVFRRDGSVVNPQYF